MLNEVAVERLFVFCLATELRLPLFDEFQSDSCVEILDPAEFVRRCQLRFARQRRWRESGLLHGPVEYYAQNRAVAGDIKDPKSIPFFKHAAYSHQCEYRLAAALSKGLRIKTSIVLPAHDLQAESSQYRSAHRLVRIGSFEDICVVHRRLEGVA